VLGEAKTLPMRWAYAARVLTGMCRYSGASTMSLMLATSAGRSWLGLVLRAGGTVVQTADYPGGALPYVVSPGLECAIRKIMARGRNGFAPGDGA